MSIYVLLSKDANRLGGLIVSAVDESGELISENDSIAAPNILPDFWPSNPWRMRPALVKQSLILISQMKPRWVWRNASDWFSVFQEANIFVNRCHDLQLVQHILRNATIAKNTDVALKYGPYKTGYRANFLKDVDDSGQKYIDSSYVGAKNDQYDLPLFDIDYLQRDYFADQYQLDFEELLLHIKSFQQIQSSKKIKFLCAIESLAAYIALELKVFGMPWSEKIHDELLREELGNPSSYGGLPSKMVNKANIIRDILHNPVLNPDAPDQLLRALKNVGINVKTTRKWELSKIDHEVIPHILEYKKMSRLYSSNGWAWLDKWVYDSRFHGEYLVGGVVTGRWAAHGGGALQIPAIVRRASVADQEWSLVVADASQLEPRILAAVSKDLAMAKVASVSDMYLALVEQGVCANRKLAKYGILGALYGGSTGQSAIALPNLRRAYPVAMSYVETAARQGEKGLAVDTFLGRSSPDMRSSWWAEYLQQGFVSDYSEKTRKAKSFSRSWGRFTRNFVCQGTAAEWAMLWLAQTRNFLYEKLGQDAHLAYFLHDEVVVHCKSEFADIVSKLIIEAADSAAKIFFDDFPVNFPLNVSIVNCYADSK